jgi:hypothetical protein
LFSKPVEDKPGDETDEALGFVNVGVGGVLGYREYDVVASPEKPVGEFLIKLFGDGLNVKGAVELVGDSIDGRIAGRTEFIEAEGQVAQPFNGGADGRADFIREGAQFNLSILAFACPGEGKLASVLGDVAHHVHGADRGERFLHSAAGSHPRQFVLRPLHVNRPLICATGTTVTSQQSGEGNCNFFFCRAGVPNTTLHRRAKIVSPPNAQLR